MGNSCVFVSVWMCCFKNQIYQHSKCETTLVKWCSFRKKTDQWHERMKQTEVVCDRNSHWASVSPTLDWPTNVTKFLRLFSTEIQRIICIIIIIIVNNNIIINNIIIIIIIVIILLWWLHGVLLTSAGCGMKFPNVPMK